MDRFPSAIFREDPATFEPAEARDIHGELRVHSWGLYPDAEVNEAGEMDPMASIMKRMMGSNNNMLFYQDYPNPMSQFLGVLIKRKEAKILADPEILEAVSKRSLTIRGDACFL